MIIIATLVNLCQHLNGNMFHSTREYMNVFKSEINAFKEVARVGSLSKASERLSMNQPAVSKAIQRLEQDLGDKLLIRGREGIALTQKGEELLIYLRHCENSTQVGRDLEKLTIGCHQSIALGTFPTLLPKLKAAFPQTDINFQFLPSLEVTRKVASLEIDLGIVINPLKRQQLVFKTIGKDFVAMWQSKKATEAPILTLIHPDMFLAAKVKPGMEVLQVPDYEVISHMVVANSEYAAVLPAEIARRYQLKQLGEKKLFEVNRNLIMHEDRFGPQERKKFLELF